MITEAEAWRLLDIACARTDLSYEAKGVLATCLVAYGFRCGWSVRVPSRPQGALEELERAGHLRHWSGADGELYAIMGSHQPT